MGQNNTPRRSCGGQQSIMTGLATFARSAARGLGVRVAVGPGALNSLKNSAKTGTRSFAAGGGKSETYEGVTIHHASTWHRVLAEGFGGLMWFWIFYRLRCDYDTFCSATPSTLSTSWPTRRRAAATTESM